MDFTFKSRNSEIINRFAIFITLSILYFFSQFLRTIVAIMSHNFETEFGIDKAQLGLLGSVFFYSFAFFQIPIGIMLDKFGPKKTITLYSLIGGIGTLFFALSHNFYFALFNRALMGIGMACVLMGSLKVFVLKYPENKFSFYSGLLISLGYVGTVFSTTPLAYLNTLIGWRKVMFLSGLLVITLSGLIFILLKDETNHNEKEDIKSLNMVLKIITDKSFWQIGAISFCSYGTFVALQGLWLGPYFMEIKKYSVLLTGNILFMLAIGSIVGPFFMGYIKDHIFKSNKKIVLVTMFFYGLLYIFFFDFAKISFGWYFLICFLIGFLRSSSILTYTHIKSLYPANISGIATSCINIFVMAGGGAFMHIIGKIVDFFGDANNPNISYKYAFLLCAISIFLSVIIYAFSREEKKSH